MSHSKCWFSIIIIMLLYFAVNVSAYTITTISNGNSTENLTFQEYSNVTRYLQIPMFSNVTSAKIDIQGKNYAGYLVELEPINYSCVGNHSDCGNATDNNYDTYIQKRADSETTNITFNFTKIPESSLNSKMQVRWDGFSFNFSFLGTANSPPQACFYNNVVSVKFIQSINDTNNLDFYCYNGSQYVQYYHYFGGINAYKLYDIRMYYHTNITRTYHSTNTSQGNFIYLHKAYDDNLSSYASSDNLLGVPDGTYNVTLNYSDKQLSYFQLVTGDYSNGIKNYYNYSALHKDCDYPYSIKIVTTTDGFGDPGWVAVYCKNNTGFLDLAQSPFPPAANDIYEFRMFRYNYPSYSNLTIDEQYVWNYSSILNDTITANFTSALNSILPSCSCANCTSSSDYCTIPLTFHSNTTGIMEVYGINITYNYSINVLVYNEDTQALITADNTKVDFISTDYAINYTTQTSNNTVNLLVGTYIVRYSSDSYVERFYYFDLDNSTNSTLKLYLISSVGSVNVTATVYDEIGRVVEGAYIRYLRYETSTNSYILSGISRTDVQGEAILDVYKNTDFYKFIIYYPINTWRFTSEQTYITKDDIEFQINIGQSIGADLEAIWSISSNITYINASRTFRLIALDNNGVSRQFCMEVNKINAKGNLLYNSSCSTSSSVIINIAILNESGTTYDAKAYVYIDGDKRYLTGNIHSFPQANIQFGQMGLFIVMIMTIVFISMFPFAPWLAAIGLPLPAWFGIYMGILDIPYLVPISILIGGFVVAFLVDKKSTI